MGDFMTEKLTVNIEAKSGPAPETPLPIGCQSTSHDRRQCWGELWQCDECRSWVCHADGTDDGTSDYLLCDACWAKKHEEK